MVRNNDTRPRRTTPRESARDKATPANHFSGKSSVANVDRHTQQLLSDSFSATKPPANAAGWEASVTLYLKGTPGAPGITFDIHVPAGGTYSDVARKLSAQIPGLDAKSLFIVETMQNRLNKTVYTYGQKVPEKCSGYRSSDDLVAFDLLGQEAQAAVAEAQGLGSPKGDDDDTPAYMWNANSGLVSPEGSTEVALQVRVGFIGSKKGYQLWSMGDLRPLVLAAPKGATNGQLRALVAEQVTPFVCSAAVLLGAPDGPVVALYPLDNYGKPSMAGRNAHSYNFTDADNFIGLGADGAVFDRSAYPGGVAAIFTMRRHLDIDKLNARNSSDQVDLEVMHRYPPLPLTCRLVLI